MSYNTTIYLVDVSDIEKIWGCQDQNILEAFLKKHKDDIEEQSDWFDISPSLFRLYMQDIINGKISQDAEHYYLYGYLYEMMCQDDKEGKVFYELLSHLSDVIGEISKTFIPIPRSDDWPYFYSVKKANIEEARTLFLKVTPETKDFASEDYYIEEVNQIFDAAKKHNKDVVFANY